MTKIKLGRDYFSMQHILEDWCKQNIGPGRWCYNLGECEPELKWGITSSFGMTWFEFRNDADATMFVLRWIK